MVRINYVCLIIPDPAAPLIPVLSLLKFSFVLLPGPEVFFEQSVLLAAILHLLVIYPVLCFLPGNPLIILDSIDVMLYLDLVNLEVGNLIIQVLKLFVKLNLFVRELIGFGFGKHLGLDHSFSDSFLL